MVGASIGAGWDVVEYGDGYGGGAAFAEVVGYADLENELGIGCDFGGGEGRLEGGVDGAELYLVAAEVYLLPPRHSNDAVAIGALRAVELDGGACVDFGATGAGVGDGWGVVEYGDGYGGGADFAEVVGYCELEGELGVGFDFGGGEGGIGGVGGAEIDIVVTIVYLLPGVRDDAAVAVFAGGAVKLDGCAFVDLLVIAGFGAGRGVVDDADADVSVAAFAEAVGYCELED